MYDCLFIDIFRQIDKLLFVFKKDCFVCVLVQKSCSFMFSIEVHGISCTERLHEFINRQ